MKLSIEGFNQAYAMTLRKEVEKNGKKKVIKIDCTDLVILRWFVDFYPRMKKMEFDGVQYAWLSHNKLKEDLPIVDISKKSFIERMKKLVEFEILEYKIVKSEGTFSLYRFGKNYGNMITFNFNTVYIKSDTVSVQTDTGYPIKQIPGSSSTVYGEVVQPDTKDISIINKSIKNNISNNINLSIYSLDDIKKQIDYDHHKDRKIDEIVLLMNDVLNSSQETIKIAGAYRQSSEVKERFLQLNFFHIEYVLECMNNNTSEIKNIKAYMLTCLYNAPMTMDSYYENRVKKDLG